MKTQLGFGVAVAIAMYCIYYTTNFIQEKKAEHLTTTSIQQQAPQSEKAILSKSKSGYQNTISPTIKFTYDGAIKQPDPVVDQGIATDANSAASLPDISMESGLFSLKKNHIQKLKQSNVIETRDYTGVDEKLVRVTLVRAPSALGEFFIIRENVSKKTGQVESVHVEVGEHLIVQFQHPLSETDLAHFTKDYDFVSSQKMLLPNTYRFNFSAPTLDKKDALFAKLANDNRVNYADTNFVTYSTAVPNDPLFESLWGMDNRGVDPVQQLQFVQDTDSQATIAWDKQTDCSAVPVAVLDTGIDANHPDLADNVLANAGRNFSTNNINDFVDRQGHGTHVSGTIGAIGNNAEGVAGICWKAAIIPVKVLGDDGTGTTEAVVNGLVYVASTNAKVLNMSLGGGGFSQPMVDAIAMNTDNGKILVAAAGNENNDNDLNPSYPASYNDSGIISVAAVHGAGDLAEFSNYGQTSVDIAAPGQSIASTFVDPNDPNVGYAVLSGTSMASPLVAGAVALFWAFAPELSAQDIKAELLDSAVSLNFGKNIAGGRMINMNLLMESIKAQAFVAESDFSIKANNSSRYSLSIDTKEKYSDIEKIEVFLGNKLIGQTTGSADKVNILLPIGLKEGEITITVTDSKGNFNTTFVDLVARVWSS